MEDDRLPDNDKELLEAILALADRLADSGDALMEGQYAHLRDRVAALIVMRSFADEDRA